MDGLLRDVRLALLALAATAFLACGGSDGVAAMVLSILARYADASPDPRLPRVTLRHLLQMRSGIHFYENPYPGSPLETLNNSRGDWVRIALEQPFNPEPGALWQYNSGGVIAPGAAVAQAAGTPFNVLARERLFAPLGISGHVEASALLVIPSSRSWAAPPREGYVPVEGGLRLHYREIGQGKDTVIIPSDVGWGTRADGLARGRTVVLYDPRGHGRSDEIKDPSLVGMDYEVRDIEALRRHLSLKRVSLVGWSYMGALVALYAARYPERVDAVVQVGPMPLRKSPHFEAYLKNTQARRDPAADERLAQMQKDGLPERDPVAYCKAFYEAAARTMVAKPDVTGILPAGLCDLPNERPTGRPFSVTGRLFETLGDWDFTAQAGAVRARVLTVHGARDGIPLESSRAWVEAFKNARLLVFEESGHLPFAEQPTEFTRAVDTFLKGAWPQGAEAGR